MKNKATKIGRDTLWYLSNIEHKSPIEIGKILGVSEPTIRKRLKKFKLYIPKHMVSGSVYNANFIKFHEASWANAILNLLESNGPTDLKTILAQFGISLERYRWMTRIGFYEKLKNIDELNFTLALESEETWSKKTFRIGPVLALRGDERIVSYIINAIDRPIESKINVVRLRRALKPKLGERITTFIIEGLGYSYSSEHLRELFKLTQHSE